jgi:hypothetical protein
MVRLWSDGPSGQFKNQYLYHFLPLLLHRYNLQFIQWNFFATSHGKGAVDGVGVIAKRAVWNKIKARQSTVKSAQDFVDVVTTGCVSIIAKCINDFDEQFLSTNKGQIR